MSIQEIKKEIGFLMQWLHDNHDPHSKLIISQTKVDLIQELEGYTSYDVFEQEKRENLLTRKKHQCRTPENASSDAYGSAIYECYENDENQLIATNDEYASQVDFCPYCGFEAENKIK